MVPISYLQGLVEHRLLSSYQSLKVAVHNFEKCLCHLYKLKIQYFGAHLQPNSMVEDADEQDMFHQQSVGHQGWGDAGCKQHLREGVVHVFSAAAHVQLLQLTTDGCHVGLTQSEEKDKQTNKPKHQSLIISIKRNCGHS